MSMQQEQALFADYAYLPEGWCRDVLLQWNDEGVLTHVTAQSGPPIGVTRAVGPIIPGMPNLHSHAFQRALAGLTEYRATANTTDTFWSWREMMYRFVAHLTPDALAAIARWLYIDMLKAGYTSVCEFHYLHHAPGGSHYANIAELAERVVEAAASTGIGMTMLPVLYQTSGFGLQAPRAEQRRFINTLENLLDILNKLRSARPTHAALTYGVAPHSLRAVPEASLRALIDAIDASVPHAPVHIHIAEQTAEVSDCVAATGMRPVAWLLDHFDVNARWCVVHATHLNANEITALATSQAVAGLCLTTEANLGDGLFPAQAYLEQGGYFGIGSDSHIGIDWRAELRMLEYGQRLTLHARNVLATAAQPYVAERLFDAALAGGAQASGRAIGALRVGHCADWIVLDPHHPNIAERAPHAWLSSIIFCEHPSTPIHDVYTGGKHVVRARHHIDEHSAYAAYREAIRAAMASLNIS